MDEKTKAVLEDLKKDFGRQKILSPKDIAEVIGRSEQGLANLKCRGGFDIQRTPPNGSGVSIYDMAEWLAHGKVSAKEPAKPSKSSRKVSLARAILAINLQRQFLSELFSELEAIAIAPPLKDKKKKQDHSGLL